MTIPYGTTPLQGTRCGTPIARHYLAKKSRDAETRERTLKRDILIASPERRRCYMHPTSHPLLIHNPIPPASKVRRDHLPPNTHLHFKFDLSSTASPTKQIVLFHRRSKVVYPAQCMRSSLALFIAIWSSTLSVLPMMRSMCLFWLSTSSPMALPRAFNRFAAP